MRRVLACARCRGHKIKCVHNNKPPCSYCKNKGLADNCVLTFPLTKKPKKEVASAIGSVDGNESVNGFKSKYVNQELPMQVPMEDRHFQQSQRIHGQGIYGVSAVKQMGVDLSHFVPVHYGQADKTFSISSGAMGTSQQILGVHEFQSNMLDVPMDATGYENNGLRATAHLQIDGGHSDWLQNRNVVEPRCIQDLAPAIPARVVLYAIECITLLFPEYRFFYMPTIKEQIPRMNPIIIGAIMAQASFYLPLNTKSSVLGLEGYRWLGVDSYNVRNSVYERLTTDAIFNTGILLSKPDIEIVGAMLLLSITKWGHSDYYTSWMIHGCAARMAQALFFDEHFTDKAEESAQQQEMILRAFWCAFLLDRIIYTGEHRTLVIHNHCHIQLPLGDNEISVKRVNKSKDEPKFTLNRFYEVFKTLPKLVKIGRDLAMLIKIYSIWGQLNDFLMNKNDTSNKDSRPWDKTTEIGKILHDLNEWKTCIPEELEWSVNKYMCSDSIFRKNTIYLMLNSLYLLSEIFITRDYLPFLPHSVNKPSDVNLPTPEDENYWEENARRCFNSTRKLSEIVSTLLDDSLQKSAVLNIQNPVLITPFYSFVAFICAVQCSYGINFPWMDPDHHIYEVNQELPQSLVYCCKKMISLLKLKTYSYPVTKNWFSILMKTQVLYEFVSKNREYVVSLNWNTENFKNIKEGLISGQEYKKYRSLKSSKTEPNSNLLNAFTDMYGSSGSFEARPDSTVIYKNPHVTTENSQNGTYLKYEFSNIKNQVLESELPPLKHEYLYQRSISASNSFPPPQAMYPVNTQKDLVNSNVDHFYQNPFTSANHNINTETPGTRPPTVQYSNQGVSGLEPDTDKISLLFNEHEMDLLLQFSV